LSLFLINWATRLEDMWRSGGLEPPYLTSATNGGEWSASCPGHCIRSERTPDVHWIGGWVGPRGCLTFSCKEYKNSKECYYLCYIIFFLLLLHPQSYVKTFFSAIRFEPKNTSTRLGPRLRPHRNAERGRVRQDVSLQIYL
jgi:hypothetical protein